MLMDEKVKELNKLTRKKALLQARIENIQREVDVVNLQISELANSISVAHMTPSKPSVAQVMPALQAR